MTSEKDILGMILACSAILSRCKAIQKMDEKSLNMMVDAMNVSGDPEVSSIAKIHIQDIMKANKPRS